MASLGQPMGLPLEEHVVLKGYLLKKKSKRLQGFARRHFTLSNTGVLSYSFTPDTPARQRVNIHHCTISVPHPPPPSQHPQPPGHVPRTPRSFNIDTGREVWHLRALNEADFDLWTNTLGRLVKSGGAGKRKRESLGMAMMGGKGRALEEVERLGTDLETLQELLNKVKAEVGAKRQPSRQGSFVEAHQTEGKDKDHKEHPAPTEKERPGGGGKLAKIFKKGHSKAPNVNGGTEGSLAASSSPGLTVTTNGLPSTPSSSSFLDAHTPTTPSAPTSRSLSQDSTLSSHLGSLFDLLESMKQTHSALTASLSSLALTPLPPDLTPGATTPLPPIAEAEGPTVRGREAFYTPPSQSASFSSLSGNFLPSLLPGLTTFVNPAYGLGYSFSSSSLGLGRRSSLDSTTTAGGYVDAEEGEFLEVDGFDEESDELVEDEKEGHGGTLDSSVASSSILKELKGSEESVETGLEPKKEEGKLNKVAREKRREQLPAPVSGEELSLGGLIRKSIGKDMTKMAMPISMNEPLSALQRVAEEFEYSSLLDKAAASAGEERTMWIAAFAVSAFGGTAWRGSRKPFNPMMGETYELVDEEQGMKFIAEKVSHHPPIMAAHVEGKGWTVEGTSGMNQKFWGRSVEFTYDGSNRIKFEDGEEYGWTKPSTFIENIMQPEKKINHKGKMHVTRLSPSHGPSATITFDAGSRDIWGNLKNATDTDWLLKGEVKDSRGKKAIDLVGRWNECFMRMKNEDEVQILWRCSEFPHDCRTYYGFSKWAIGLNELRKEIEPFLPPTDSRLRPDQRLFENGKVDEAEKVKTKLEAKQRKRREEHGEVMPSFFVKKGEDWVYRGGYWERRKKKDWKQAPDIF
ncbi:hypothetical protein BT69DRAFT_1347639 [Atractiella rhizophila]|nr:hypothetical protein BT69DRAFT_1347639 [Atractiella rhizophila]